MPGMLPSQVAGRHGSYATQFWRKSATPHYRTRADMRVAYSRKALDRRLVLPLDSHNWVRSLEVLNAGYARLGRTPEHYQAVLRDMVEHHGVYAELADGAGTSAQRKKSGHDAVGDDNNAFLGSSAQRQRASNAADIVPAIDALRDKAYAGEIPSNGSLWVTLVWAYCTLQQPQDALDTFHQAKRRFHFSAMTLQHMAELLLPTLCRHGALEEATALYEEYLKPNPDTKSVNNHGRDSSEAAHVQSHVSRSRSDDAQARRWLAEAAALQGNWKKMKEFASAAAATPEPGRTSHRTATEMTDVRASNGTGVEFPTSQPTINSLFQSQETSPRVPNTKPSSMKASPQQQQTATALDMKSRPTTTPSPSSSLPLLSTLSPTAVRRLFQTLCRDTNADLLTPPTTSSLSAAETHSSPSCDREEAPRRLTDALACWEHLYGPLPSSTATESTAQTLANAVQERRAPPIEDVHELLNLLASHRCWTQLLDFFSVVFLHRPSAVYLNATPADVRSLRNTATSAERGDEEVTMATTTRDDFSSSVFFPYSSEVPLDSVTLNLVFACLPKAAEPLRVRTQPSTSASPPTFSHHGQDSQVLMLPASSRPLTVVHLLDDLLTLRDDMVLTDVVMSVVGPALLQVGETARVFELLARTPMMVRGRERKAAVQLTSYERELKAVLVSLGYAAYALSSSASRRADMVRRMPHLFPPEVIRRLASSTQTDSSGSQDSGTVSTSLAVLEGPVLTAFAFAETDVLQGRADAAVPVGESSQRATPPSSQSVSSHANATSLLDRKWEQYTNAPFTHQQAAASAASPFGHASGASPHRKSSAQPRGRSSATLTALADDAMRRDFVRLHERRDSAFTGSHADADRDPRPMPVGLHDHASGWDFFGRGGEKVFSNHKRTPHPFTMQPKVMRDLRNPYRGWNPRQNSSLAHKENVIKWNGKSSV